MARITGQILRARLVEHLTKPLPLSLVKPQADYSHLDLLSIPTDEAFVTEAYRRILLREPDLDGMHYYLRALQTQRQLVIDALAGALENIPAAEQAVTGAGDRTPINPRPGEAAPKSSPGLIDLTDLDQFENEDALVRESYRRILGRQADPGGLAHYRELLVSGVPKVQVLALFAGSTEARARNVSFLWHGAALPGGEVDEGAPGLVDLTGLDQLENVDALVKESYRRILGREADPRGFAFYRDLLLGGAPKLDVLSELAGSTEARARNVSFLWHGAALPGGEVDEGAPGLVDLTGLDQLENEDALVKDSYRRILGREADPRGFAFYRDLLLCGAPKIHVLSELAGSTEARERNVRFLWHGAALPAPGRLRLPVRLRRLYRRRTGWSKVENPLSF